MKEQKPKGPAPAFQCYAADHLATAAQMSDEQFGKYWRLSLIAWRERGIPADHDALAGILRVTRRQFPALWAVIGQHFQPGDDGRLHLEWQEREREKQADNRKKRQDAANARWGKGNSDADDEHVDGEVHANADANALQNTSLSTSSSTSKLPAASAAARAGDHAGGSWATDPKALSLLALLESDAQRSDVSTLLDRVPHALAWVAELTMALDPNNMHGKQATPTQLAEAARHFVGNGEVNDGMQPRLMYFQVYLRNAVNGKQPPPARAAGGRSAKISAPYDASQSGAAADSLTRQLED
jgi:uncharacterized protein YdaU (DUF1376 family)